MKYEINGKIVETQSALSEDEIDEIATSINQQNEQFITPQSAVAGKEAAKMVGQRVVQIPLNIAKDAAGMALGAVDQAKQGLYDIPKALVKAPSELANTLVNNKKPNLSLASYTREQTGAMAEGVKNMVKDPLGTVIEHPLGTALALQGIKGAAKTGFDLTGIKTALKNTGARQVAKDIGLNETTLKSILKKGETPETGTLRMAQTLSDDGILKNSANESATAFKAKQAELGRAVQDIKARIGKESFVDNADAALNPIKEMIVKADKAATSEARALGKTPNEIYSALVKDARKSGNKLTLDAIDKKLDEVGNLIDKGSVEKKANNRALYGKLAQIRDQIVSDVAKGIGDPKLRQEYLQANEKYSFYKRLEVAISKEALSEALGKRGKYSVFEPRESLKNFFGALTSKALEKPVQASMKGLIALSDNNELKRLREKLKNAK